MNVPLKKRYNYCAINNENLSLATPNTNAVTDNTTAATYTNLMFKNRDNNNQSTGQPICIDIEQSPQEKSSTAICTLSTTLMPASVKGMQNVRLQQQNVQHAGNVIRPIHTDSQIERTNLNNNKPISLQAIDKETKAINLNSAAMISEHSSSSVVITSSASNHSFALSEQNDEKSSSQCSRKLIGIGAQKNDGSQTFSSRHQNKYLTESSIKLMELHTPAMTSRERIMNWKITDAFSDVEDDFVDSRCLLPFRSERLQKRTYKKPIKLLDGLITSNKSSYKSATNTEKSSYVEIPIKKSKLLSVSMGAKTSGSGSSSDAGNIQRRPSLQKMLAKRILTKHPNHCRKRQLMPVRQLLSSPTSSNQRSLCTNQNAGETPSAIKLRIDYTKKTPSVQTAFTSSSDNSRGPDSFKVPSVPIDKHCGSDSQATSRKCVNSPVKYSIFINKKIATPPKNHVSADNSHENITRFPDCDDHTSTTSSNEVAEISKTRTKQEEFYKYLGIDTNPCHDKLSPGSSTGDTNSSSNRRRSLRVKIQQKVAKSSEKLKEIENVMECNESKTEKCKSVSPNSNIVDENGTKRLNGIKDDRANIAIVNSIQNKETREPLLEECSDHLSKIVKISYIKNEEKVNEPKSYKSICLVNNDKSNIQKNCSESNLLPAQSSVQQPSSSLSCERKSRILERRSYEIVSMSERELISNRKATYTTKVLGAMQATEITSNSLIEQHQLTKETHGISSNMNDEILRTSSPPLSVKIEDKYVPNTCTEQDANCSNIVEILANKEDTINDVIDESIVIPPTKMITEARNPNKSAEEKSTKRKLIIRKAITLTEMFNRYKRCLRQGIAIKSQLNQQIQRGPRKRPTNARKYLNRSLNEQQPIISNDSLNTVTDNKQESLDKTDSQATLHLPSTSNQGCIAALPHYEDIAFSPTSITHSNASTDSAIVVSTGNERISMATNILNTVEITPKYPGLKQSLNHLKVNNPLNPQNGCVHAILTHCIKPDNQIVIVVQESALSFWRMTPNLLGIFGVAPAWEPIGTIKRITNDIEIDTLYQNRIIGEPEKFPAYVEFRSRESPPNDSRQCCLSFVYANVYFLKENGNQYQLQMESIHLDTIKGLTQSIIYIGIPKTTHILMSWNEQSVNRTRTGICKYVIKMPDYDSVDSILDFAYLTHHIKSLFSINDNQVIGFGERTLSMWDHRSGNLLMNFQMDLPTTGESLGCQMINYGESEYLLLMQLVQSEQNPIEQKLQLIAVNTTNEYSWRTLQSHNIPHNFGRKISTLITDDMFAVTFTDGNAILLNLISPQNIYIRNESTTNARFKSENVETLKNEPKTSADAATIHTNQRTDTHTMQAFVQTNGQIIEISSDHFTTKSVWEYFIEK